MKIKWFVYLVVWRIAMPIITLGQHVTYYPEVEEASVDDVSITKVEVTSEYTAVYLRFTAGDNVPSEEVPERIPPQFRRFYRQPPVQPQIWLDPNIRLYKPGDVNTKFKFLRAEGIPVKPDRKFVEPDEVVEFIVYFEKVTPGIEVIDFYEGRSGPDTRAWNFYGIHINNPAPGKAPSYPDKQIPNSKQDADLVEKEQNTAASGFLGLSGNVLDALTGASIPARITYVEDGDTISLNTQSGKFKVGLEAGKRYHFRAYARGYREDVWELDTTSDTLGNALFTHDFQLTPLSEGATFKLENIYFETSSFNLLSESFNELDRFVTMMKDNPNLRIRIEGHTDNVGDFEKNVTLSQHRAEAVKRYLVEKGIAADRIETKGYGPTRPEAKGNSDDERRKNRRVEIVILKS